jgi:hypothetical protein
MLDSRKSRQCCDDQLNLGSTPRSVFRLYRKLDAYLKYIASDEYRTECGAPTPDRTDIAVCLHKDSDPAIYSLLHGFEAECLQRGAGLEIQV